MKKLFFAFLSIVALNCLGQVKIVTNGNVSLDDMSIPFSKFSFGQNNKTISSRIAFYEKLDGTEFIGIGIAQPAANVFGIGIWSNTGTAILPENNNMRMFIANNGNVGVGVVSPDAKLTVKSQIKILRNGDGRTAGNFAELIFGEIGDEYSGSIKLVNTQGAPTYLNPKMVFSLQDSAQYTSSHVKERMTILSNGNIGIGTNNPDQLLTISDIDSPVLRFDRSDINKHDWEIYSKSGGSLIFRGGGDGVGTSLTDRFLITTDGNVGIGTTDTFGRKLAVNGNAAFKDEVDASEFRVYAPGSNSIGDAGTSPLWPDYVFEKDYNLLTLKEVEKHIKEKKHLPNVPSAKEVEEKGSFSLGEMNKKLLEKVEELTLYLIDQNKKLEKQEKRIKALEDKLASKKE